MLFFTAVFRPTSDLLGFSPPQGAINPFGAVPTNQPPNRFPGAGQQFGNPLTAATAPPQVLPTQAPGVTQAPTREYNTWI